MKTLMATAAVVVIATCGFFVYDNLQSKAAIVAAEEAVEERVSYISCLKSLQEIKERLKEAGVWEGYTHKERLEELNSLLSTIKDTSWLAMMYEIRWDECGPI